MSNPFARSIALHAAILSILAVQSSHLLAGMAINNLPAYKSRGKGGKFGIRSKTFHISNNRPHDGKKQRNPIAPVSIPRRMWSVSYLDGVYALKKKFSTRAAAFRAARKAGSQDLNDFVVALS
jgi:hypothetical protein